MSAEEKWWQDPEDDGGHTYSHSSGRTGLDRLMEEHPIISLPLTIIAVYAGACAICSVMDYAIAYFKK